MTGDKKSVERREFLRRAAATGVAAAWAAPIVQTVAATPAFASHQGTPHACQHSLCVAAFNEAADAQGRSECKQMGGGQNFCDSRCPIVPGTDRACNCDNLCDSSQYTFSPDSCTPTVAGCP